MVSKTGSQAQDFTLPALDNKQYSLVQALRDGPVLAAFFKVTCPVCQFTLPFLDRFHRHFRDSKAHIWAISQDEPEPSREFATEYGLAMPVLLDDTREYPTSNAYGITHVPSLFLIAQNGEILRATVGFHKQDMEQMARQLQILTGKKGFVPFREQDEVPDSRAG